VNNLLLCYLCAAFERSIKKQMQEIMDPIAFGFRMTKAKRQAKETTGGVTWKNAQDFLQMELFGLALPSPFLKLKRV
jgi:hypothetical protein